MNIPRLAGLAIGLSLWASASSAAIFTIQRDAIPIAEISTNSEVETLNHQGRSFLHLVGSSKLRSFSGFKKPKIRLKRRNSLPPNWGSKLKRPNRPVVRLPQTPNNVQNPLRKFGRKPIVRTLSPPTLLAKKPLLASLLPSPPKAKPPLDSNFERFAVPPSLQDRRSVFNQNDELAFGDRACGPTSCKMVLSDRDKQVALVDLAEQSGLGTAAGTTSEGLVKALKTNGVNNARIERLPTLKSLDAATRGGDSALVGLRFPTVSHKVVVDGIYVRNTGNKKEVFAKVRDPSGGQSYLMKGADLKKGMIDAIFTNKPPKTGSTSIADLNRVEEFRPILTSPRSLSRPAPTTVGNTSVIYSPLTPPKPEKPAW